MSTDGHGMGFTRARDLIAVAVVTAIVIYLLVLWNYRNMPTLPRFAGLVAAVLGVGEALAGLGIRSRIMAPRDQDGRPTRPPVPPLVAARAVMTAKATSLAGSAFGGLWLALLIYLLPKISQLSSAQADLPAALVGVIGSLIMVSGALFLESCCRTPKQTDSGTAPHRT